MTFQNSSDEKSILILSHGASYFKSLYVLSTHSHDTALQFCLKNISTGKQMFILVCTGFVRFSVNLTPCYLSLYYYYVISRRREKSPQIADPEMLRNLLCQTRLAAPVTASAEGAAHGVSAGSLDLGPTRTLSAAASGGVATVGEKSLTELM